MTAGFIDTNIVIYHLAKNHPDHSPRCSEYLEQLSLGKRSAVSSVTVVVEATYILDKLFGLPRADIAPALAAVVKIAEIQFEHRQAILDALVFWSANSPLSFPDCYHLALTKSLGLDAIYTFDRKMDRYPGITRLEP